MRLVVDAGCTYIILTYYFKIQSRSTQKVIVAVHQHFQKWRALQQFYVRGSSNPAVHIPKPLLGNHLLIRDLEIYIYSIQKFGFQLLE